MKLRYISKHSVYDNFLNSIGTESTKKTFTYHLKKYLKFSQLSNYGEIIELAKQSPDDTFQLLRDYITVNIKQNGVSANYMTNSLAAIKSFYEMNNIMLPFWKQLGKYKGKARRVIDDRLYTNEELHQLIENANLRTKVIIFTLLSTGMRVGGLSTLTLGDIQYIEQYKLYKYTVYAKDISERYTTFCTPECATILKLYLETREKLGETLTKDSPYLVSDMPNSKSRFVSSTGIAIILERQRYRAAVMARQRRGLTIHSRKDVPRSHVYRKMFNTRCIEAGMNHYIKERLMGHKVSLGLDIHYYRPTESQLLAEYLKTANHLTVSEENRLKDENYKLKAEAARTEKIMIEILDKFEKWERTQSG